MKTADEGHVLRAKAPTSSFDDSSSSSSPHRVKAPGAVDSSRLFVSQSPLESPMRRRRSLSGDRSPPGKSSSGRDQSRHFHEKSGDFLTVASNPDAREAQGFLRRADDSAADSHSSDSGGQKGEKTESLVSTESLEVADIFQNPGTNGGSQARSEAAHGMAGKAGRGQLEPAMISIVLEVVDGNLMEKLDNFDADDARHQPRLLHHPAAGRRHRDAAGSCPPAKAAPISRTRRRRGPASWTVCTPG